jgi:hypothetical protein
MKKLLVLIATHALAGVIGFAIGIYTLPILTAPPAPSAEEVTAARGDAEFQGEFRRDLKGSDFLHWGEGTVYVSRTAISLLGQIAPGPDYKLYLSPEFVETEADFTQLKPKMVRVGDVRTFDNFTVPVPENIDPSEFTTVIVWCESFGEFITAARYQ